MHCIKTVEGIERHLVRLVEIDAKLVPIKRMAGPLPLRLSRPDFSGLAQIVVSQHVSKQSASAIMKRLASAVSPLTSRHLIETRAEILIESGLTRAKCQTLRDVAAAEIAGDLNLSAISQMPCDQAIASLTALKGIGPWTAEVFLIFCAGHVDVFPAGDVALRTAIGEAFNIRPRPSEREIRKISGQWAPLRGIAARLFWAYYSVRKQATR